MVQFVAGLALLALVAWLANLWLGLFGAESFYTGAFIWIVAMCLIAWLYDRRQAQLRKSNRATTEPD
jgi:hypothetical protein